MEESEDKSQRAEKPGSVLLTGASGFIGGHLRPLLESSGMTVLTLARDGIGGAVVDVDVESSVEAWAAALAGVDAVIHLAAIAHQAPDAEALASVNVDWPVRLFKAAILAGVADFVFLSSIKVFGDRSARPFQVSDPYAPDDAYGESKMRAEQAMQVLQADHPEVLLAILRSPLVYGPGVKGNFRTLLAWAARGSRGWPLPFGAARAPRSLVSVRNLCDAIVACLGHRGVYHCADAADLSVAQIFGILGVSHSRLLPVPAGLMRLLLTLLGSGAYYQRLYEPLQLDTEASEAALDWSPRYSSEESLHLTRQWWRA